MMEILKQPQYSPLSVAEIALSWFLADKGFLDDIDLKKVRNFELNIRHYFQAKHQDILNSIDKHPVFTDELAHQLKTIIEAFKQQLNQTTSLGQSNASTKRNSDKDKERQ